MQYNVAEGNGADTTGNLPVSEEAAPVAEVLGHWRWGVVAELPRPMIPLLSLPPSLLAGGEWPPLPGSPQPS